MPDFINVIDAAGNFMPMAEQVRRAVAWVRRNARSFGGDPERIYVSGHSSGAHLAAVVLTTNWRQDFDLPSDTVKGGLDLDLDHLGQLAGEDTLAVVPTHYGGALTDVASTVSIHRRSWGERNRL